MRHHNVELPKDVFVMHICDHPWCIEITHLTIGTHQDNMNDMVSKKRQSSKLREKDVRHIIEMKGKMPQWQLAKIFGVSRSNIAMIQTGRAWKHLGGDEK